MAIDVVQAIIDVNEKREQVILMDDYGAAYHVYIPVASATRQQTIQAGVTLMQNNQTAMESYAVANGHDLSAQKAAGIAKKRALIAQNKPAPFVPTPAVPTPAPTTTP
jgi:hypothetical protein